MVIRYKLSDAARQQVFVATGQYPAYRVTTELPGEALTEEQRHLLGQFVKDSHELRCPLADIEYVGGSGFSFGVYLDPADCSSVAAWFRHLHTAVGCADEKAEKERVAAAAHEDRVAVAKATLFARLAAGLRAFAAGETEDADWSTSLELTVDGKWYGKIDPSRDPEYAAAREAALPRWDALKAERERVAAAEAAVRKAAAAEEKARIARERAEWIEAHGSDHLKRATAAGYNCQRRYVTERADCEAPGFEVDFDDRADWKERSCPSEAGLAAEEEYNAAHPEGPKAAVVWLTKPATPETDDEEEYCDPEDRWQPREAVVVREYLGRYDLVREV